MASLVGALRCLGTTAFLWCFTVTDGMLIGALGGDETDCHHQEERGERNIFRLGATNLHSLGS